MLAFPFVCFVALSVVQTMPISEESAEISCISDLKTLLESKNPKGSELPECMVEVGGKEKLGEALKPVSMAIAANRRLFSLPGSAVINGIINMTKENVDFKVAVLELCKLVTIPLECVLEKAKEKDLSCDFKLLDVASESHDKDTWALIAAMYSEIEAAGLESCAKLSALLNDNYTVA